MSASTLPPCGRILTIADFARLVRSPECVSYRHYNLDSMDRGRLCRQDNFSVMADYGQVVRVCVDMRFYANATYIESKELRGYDSEKHAWTEEVAQYRTVIENRRGRKKMMDLSREIYDAGKTWSSSGHWRQYSASPAGKILKVR